MREVISRSLAFLAPGDPLLKAIRLMRLTKLEGLPVVDDQGTVQGIFTKANLFDALLSGAVPADALTPYFTREPVTVREDQDFNEVAETIRTIAVGIGIVLNAQDQVVGMFTKSDMIMALFRETDRVNATMKALYEAMYNGVISVDLNGKIVFLNRAAKVLLQEQGELYDQEVTKVFPALNLEPVFTKAERVVGIKLEAAGKFLMANITPIMEARELTGAIILLQDLSDLERVAGQLETFKNLSRTLETVIDTAYDGIMVVNAKGQITLVNKALGEFFRRPASELVGKHIEQVVENSAIPRVLKTGRAELNDIQFISGTPYVVSRLPIIENSQVVGVVGKIMFRQLEEVKELADKLDKMGRQVTYYQEELKKVSPSLTRFENIVTLSPRVINLKDEALMAARGNSTVLLTGESGTGKELFAQAIHLASPRSGGPFIKVNCAAIPENLLESEFFGYAAGAFTGAKHGGKQGKLAAAHGGTLFLDEIGDMAIGLQSKLLRVLQDKSFEPVGSNQTITVDVRIIAATNQNLEQKVREGTFRPDLYYRLNVINLCLPPLRERTEDIMPLVYTFLEKYNRLLGTNVKDVTPAVRDILRQHNWPGNVRELENVIERGINFAGGREITPESLPLYLREKTASPGNAAVLIEANQLRTTRQVTEKEAIKAALKQAKGNKSEAARLLGISRSWLYEKMERIGIKE